MKPFIINRRLFISDYTININKTKSSYKPTPSALSSIIHQMSDVATSIVLSFPLTIDENLSRIVPPHLLPFARVMVILFGVPLVLTLLRKFYFIVSGNYKHDKQYKALVKQLLREEEREILLHKQQQQAKKNNKEGKEENNASSFSSISAALHSQRDESVRQFCRLLTYRLVQQAANGRSDYEFHFRSYDFWLEFKEAGPFGLLTFPAFSTFWDCVDSQGSRDVIKEILEGRDDIFNDTKEDENADDDKNGNNNDDDESNSNNNNNAQYSSPYYYSTLHQTSVRNHYKKHEEENKSNKSQNGLRVDWSIHAGYERGFFAPKWILSCKWDRVELTRAREFGGR